MGNEEDEDNKEVETELQKRERERGRQEMREKRTGRGLNTDIQQTQWVRNKNSPYQKNG